MISGVSHGGGFKGALSYVMEKDDATVLEKRGVMSERTAAAEMRAVAAQSERVQKPVYHRWFALPEGERLTDEQWLAVVDKAEQAIGLEGHQRVVVRHSDTDGDHVHVIWNRVDAETGKAVRVSHDYAKCEQVCRQAEKEYGLQVVPGHHSWKQAGAERPPAARVATPAEERHEARTGREPFARVVADTGAQAFRDAQSWADLTDRLQRAGLTMQQYRQGLVVTDGTERAGVSAITGNEWTRAKLEKRFGETWADFQASQQSQDRTPARPVDPDYERLIGSDPVPVRQRPSQDQGRQDAERLRQQYQAYRTQFFQQVNRQDWSQRSATAWRKEQGLRADEAAARRDEAQRRKAITRAVVGRGLGRKLAYKVIDSRFEKRKREDRARATERWEQAKAELKATPRPDVRPQEFKAWLTDQACHGNAVARRHLDRIEGPKVRTVGTEARPNVRHVDQSAAAIRPPQVEPSQPVADRQAQADRQTEAEWKRLVADRTADLHKRADVVLAQATARRKDADKRMDALNRQQPQAPRGLAALVPGAQARHEQALSEWRTEVAELQKERNAHLGQEQQLQAFLGRGDGYQRVETIHQRAAREVGAEHPELAKRMEAVRERQEAQRRHDVEQRRQQALDRFNTQRQQQERDRSQGKGRGGAGY